MPESTSVCSSALIAAAIGVIEVNTVLFDWYDLLLHIAGVNWVSCECI